MRRCFAALGLVLIGVAPALAGEAAKGQWVNISDGVMAKTQEQGLKPAWPGQTTGVAVDPTTGEVFLLIPGLGVWRSADKGATFARCDGGVIGGRCETGYSLRMDPAGKRLACFMLDGKSGMTLDGGKTWLPIKNIARGYDWAAIDWAPDPSPAPGARPKAVFALVHESGGIGAVSLDAGASWNQIGKQYHATGIFGPETLVCTKEREKGILRSTDGGKTWDKVSEATPVGAATVFKGTGYWLSDQGLLASKDQGKTWQQVGELKGAFWGPFFGKDETNFVVVDRNGFQETADGGKTWTQIAPFPPVLAGEFNTRGWFLNCAWDPMGKVCYVARMSKPAYKCEY